MVDQRQRGRDCRTAACAWRGYGPDGPDKYDQVGAARMLLAAGASAKTFNKEGTSALEMAESCAKRDMYELLKQYV